MIFYNLSNMFWRHVFFLGINKTKFSFFGITIKVISEPNPNFTPKFGAQIRLPAIMTKNFLKILEGFQNDEFSLSDEKFHQENDETFHRDSHQDGWTHRK